MYSRNNWPGRTAVFVLVGTLLTVAFVAPFTLAFPNIVGPVFALVPCSVVFGGVNSAAAWAAIGSAGILRRQLSMLGLTLVVSALVEVGTSVTTAMNPLLHYEFPGLWGASIVIFFCVAQAPFWIIRMSFGLRRSIDIVEPSAFRMRFQLRDLLAMMLLVAVGAAALRWALAGAHRDVGMMIMLSYGVELFICLVVAAPSAVMVACVTKAASIAQYSLLALASAAALGCGAHNVMRAVGAPDQSYLFVVLHIAIPFTTTLVTFRVLWLSGIFGFPEKDVGK